MAVFLSKLSRFSTAVSHRAGEDFSYFFRLTTKPGFILRRSLMVVPRKFTFGKKTDLELLLKHMKLDRHEKFSGTLPSSFCVELLANQCEDMDYKLVRSRQPFFLNYRVDLLKQRVKFMEEMKLTPLQKRRNVERHPPVLMLSFEHEGFSVHYLRGLIHCGKDINGHMKFVNFLYPCHPKLHSYSFAIESNMSFICKELGVTNKCALSMAINMPCFLLWNVNSSQEDFRILHRDHGLPAGYNMDFHTALVYPPMTKLSFRLKHRLLTNKPSQQLVNELEFFSMPDILEYQFALPLGKPEDLSQFLFDSSRAEGANENAELF